MHYWCQVTKKVSILLLSSLQPAQSQIDRKLDEKGKNIDKMGEIRDELGL